MATTAKTRKPSASGAAPRKPFPKPVAVEKNSRKVEESTVHTRHGAVRVALSIIELEKTTFDNTFQLVDRVQRRTEALVKEYLAAAEWMPREGRAMLEEWTRMLQTTRKEFVKTVDQSFVHMTEYVKRLEEAVPDTAPKKSAAAKPAVKAAPRKKVVAKAAPASA